MLYRKEIIQDDIFNLSTIKYNFENNFKQFVGKLNITAHFEKNIFFRKISVTVN